VLDLAPSAAVLGLAFRLRRAASQASPDSVQLSTVGITQGSASRTSPPAIQPPTTSLNQCVFL
jgi:hypothetical protein